VGDLGQFDGALHRPLIQGLRERGTQTGVRDLHGAAPVDREIWAQLRAEQGLKDHDSSTDSQPSGSIPVRPPSSDDASPPPTAQPPAEEEQSSST
jgi:hypothetical protein